MNAAGAIDEVEGRCEQAWWATWACGQPRERKAQGYETTRF
jgi:hypothetical protein